jgi:hypothetical protein
MKIRNGFVSNSSTTSFTVSLARVIDYEKAKKIFDENNLSRYFGFYTGEDIENTRCGEDPIMQIEDWCYIDVKPGKKYLEQFKDSLFIVGYVSFDEHDLDSEEDEDKTYFCYDDFNKLNADFYSALKVISENKDVFTDIDTQHACDRDG